MDASPTKIRIRVEAYENKKLRADLSSIYEGELPMADQQQANLKSFVGDAQAKVTASRELSQSDYGTGGKVFVAVTLTCDQSPDAIDSAAQWASYLASKHAQEQHGQLVVQLQSLGIIP